MREDILEQGLDPALFPILNSKPELFPDLLWIWEGFMVLSVARQVGMSSPQPITMTDIQSFADYQGIWDPADRDDFLHHVQHLDMVFLADFRAKNPTPAAGGPPGRMGGGR